MTLPNNCRYYIMFMDLLALEWTHLSSAVFLVFLYESMNLKYKLCLLYLEMVKRRSSKKGSLSVEEPLLATPLRWCRVLWICAFVCNALK